MYTQQPQPLFIATPHSPQGAGTSLCRKKGCKINVLVRLGKRQAPSRAAGTQQSCRHSSLPGAAGMQPTPGRFPLQTRMGGSAGVWPWLPPQAALLRALMCWTKGMGVFIRLWEALCLINRPCKDCCSSRCCGLQDLGIPRVRNVGPSLESWNLIWENLSMHHDLTSTSEFLWVWILTGVWCVWKTQCVRGSQALPGQSRSTAQSTEVIWASWSSFEGFQGLNCSVLGAVVHSTLKCGQT